MKGSGKILAKQKVNKKEILAADILKNFLAVKIKEIYKNFPFKNK